MYLTPRQLTTLYNRAHDLMRNADGLHPQDAFNELLKYLYFKIQNELHGPDLIESKQDSAEQINSLFSNYLKKTHNWTEHMWQEKRFFLSSNTLNNLHSIFKDIKFLEISMDVKSAALRSFLVPEMRRGLGIFFTPDDVVKMMVEYMEPRVGQKILDPACGAGTFLTEALNSPNSNNLTDVWGADKNPKMLLLAELNLGYLENYQFHKLLGDSLYPSKDSWLVESHFDVILTNPPFGVNLNKESYDLTNFKTSLNKNGQIKKSQQSEIVFLEQCMKYLKPGGQLGIVLPKSVLTNSTLSLAREVINDMGYLTDVVFLPPETFQITGTSTTTVVLFMKKYLPDEERSEKINLHVAHVTNVGYDSTGREKEGNQLNQLIKDLHVVRKTSKPKGQWNIYKGIPKNKTLIDLRTIINGSSNSEDMMKLGEVASFVGTGNTPARSKYSEEGLFILKVGNLTGNGIDWFPRDRNFVDAKEREKRINSKRVFMLQKNDIVMTSSAHSPKYIAEKIDIISNIPDYIGGEATYVGEVMLVRPNDKIDPYILYSYLRSPEVKEQIRKLIIGQTAHLKTEDLLALPIPKKLLKPTKKLQALAELVKKESKLNEEKNKILYDITREYESISLN